MSSKNSQKPIILAIDTSCDDTSAAVTQGTSVLSNVIASQTELHKKYGGVFPTVAKQAHKENIEPVVKASLKKALVNWEDISAIAVTVGPGLAPALEIGICYAVDLANKYNKPLVSVNHVEGHLLSVLAKSKSVKLQKKETDIEHLFPALSLIVSGGHTQFVLVKNIHEYEILGATLDDAAGECLDKIGRMVNLGYPAGPVMEEFAKQGDSSRFAFPLPMAHTKDFNLSFSGMKTHTRNLLDELNATQTFTQQDVCDFCASAQFGVFRAIMYKMGKILAQYKVNSIWLGGGVAANMTLRKMIRQTVTKHLKKTKQAAATNTSVQLLVPYTKKLCMDNAAMIGIVAGLRFMQANKNQPNTPWESLATSDLTQIERQPRLSI